jgi:hypothetical protein
MPYRAFIGSPLRNQLSNSMPRETHEQTINTALGEVLAELGQGWTVQSELIGRTFEEGRRPDILIEKPEGWPIVIEAEVGNPRQAEQEAQARLGNCLITSNATVDTAVALDYPAEIRAFSGQALRNALRTTIFDYALFSTGAENQVIRFPSSGWIAGDLVSFALYLHRSSFPAWRVETLADTLEACAQATLVDQSLVPPRPAAPIVER